MIPITVSSSGTAYTSSTVIAPKDGGITKIITGISIGDVQSTWVNEASGQIPLINSLRQTLEHDQEWLDNEASESMYTQTTSDYIASDATAALASPGSAYGLTVNHFQELQVRLMLARLQHKAFEIRILLDLGYTCQLSFDSFVVIV